MPLDLQYFAEGGDGGPANNQGQNQNTQGKGTQNQPQNNEPQGKDGNEPTEPTEPEKRYSDKDVDDIINKKFKKWQEESEEKLRQSQLTAEEKEKERIKKLEQLEKDVATRDAKDSARKALNDAKLPSEFADFVFDTQEDVAKEKMDKFTKLLATYREGIVNEVMRDKTPPKPNDGKQTGKSKTDNQSIAEIAQKNRIIK